MTVGMNAAGRASGLKGTGYKQINLPTKSPQQMDLFNQLIRALGGSGGGLGKGLEHLSRLAGGDQSMFEEMEAPAYSAFERSLGQLGSRFSELGPGSMSARGGSGFRNAAGGAARELSENLASRRMALQQSAISDLLGLSQGLLGTNLFESKLMEKPESTWKSLLGSLLPGLGTGFGYAFGGPLGGALKNWVGGKKTPSGTPT